ACLQRSSCGPCTLSHPDASSLPRWRRLEGRLALLLPAARCASYAAPGQQPTNLSSSERRVVRVNYSLPLCCRRPLAFLTHGVHLLVLALQSFVLCQSQF